MQEVPEIFQLLINAVIEIEEIIKKKVKVACP